jgi:nuclear pore complex protein Nup93
VTYTTREQPQVNFGRMLGYYTRDFRAGDVAAATDYLSLMYLNADLPGELGRSYAQLTHEALRELILETREFALLLGDIRFDGTRIPGAIENRLPLIGISEHDDFLRTVTLQAAAVADDSGRITDAVLLFHLSDDFDSVIKIINRALSDACAADLGAEPLRIEPVKPRDSAAAQDGQQGSSFSLTTVDDPVIMARNFVGLYNRDAALYSKIRPNNRETCLLLIRIAEARELIEQGAWPEALDVIVGLGLLPLNSNGRIPEIRNIAQNVASHSAEVGRLIGPLLLWTITAIGRQRELMRAGGQFENETREVMSKELVVKARDCMTFAGLVSFRLPKGVWDAITIGASEMGVY